MRKLEMVLAAAIMILPVAALSGQEGYYSGSFIRLNYVQGEVVIQRSGDLGFEQGEVNLALAQGDKLAAKNGRAEIHFGKSNYLRVNDMSQVEFVNLPRGSGDPTKVNVLSGDVYLRIGFLDREKDFEIHTPDASFYILEEGLYRFTVRESAETELRVIQGSAEAAGEEGSILVQADEQLIATNGALGTHSSFSGGWDEFDRWNGSRDDLQKTSASTRYLPSEISEYENELDDNGRWVYERPYGYVWIPTVAYSDWRPYYYGRWVWYPIIGWTWVSHESWGWSTYHYGRWHWRLGLGWHWIPTIHWGPAWVNWYHGYDYYAWCPLSYYNRPVVVVDNYFYDRYYGSDYPLNSRALTVVHRNQLQDPQVHRVALSRNQVSSLGKISLKAATPDVRPSIRQSVGGVSSPAKIFSGGQIRKVEKSYGGGGSVSSPALKSPGGSGLSRVSGTGTVTARGGVLKKENLSSENRSTIGGTSGGVSSTARPSIRRITTYPSTDGATRKPSSSISGNSGGVSPRNVRSNSGSSFRDDPSPSRSRIKSYAPSEKSTSTSRSAIRTSPSRSTGSTSGSRPGITSSSPRSSGSTPASKGKAASYPSSSRIIKKNDSGGAASSSGRTYSSASTTSRTSGYIQSGSNYIRSRSTSGYAPSASVSRPEARSALRSATPRYDSQPARNYSAPRSSSPSSRSYSPSRSSSSSSRSFSAPRQSYSAPRMSSPSVRSGSSSSGSVSRSAPRSSSGSSSRPSSGRVVKKG